MLALWAVAAAVADERDAWELLHDAFLDEAADGDLAAAAAQYEMLVRTLGVDDPIRTEALYDLARVRFASGNPAGARTALDEALRVAGPVRPRCLDLLAEIDIQTAAIQALPVRWTFDDPAILAIVHPRGLNDVGSALIVPLPFDATDPALRWRTAVDARSEDRLVIGLTEGAGAVTSVKFRARAEGVPVRLAVDLVDDLGRTWGASTESGGVSVPVDVWTTVEVRTADLVVGGGPSTIERIIVRKPSSSGGDVLIDDFEVQ